jgi:hypothetical protein
MIRKNKLGWKDRENLRLDIWFNLRWDIRINSGWS